MELQVLDSRMLVLLAMFCYLIMYKDLEISKLVCNKDEPSKPPHLEYMTANPSVLRRVIP